LFISVVVSREHANKLASGMELGVTWRPMGIRYRTNNEILIDIVESLDAILDQRGTIVKAEVNGVVR
jgi:hypothetical protein